MKRCIQTEDEILKRIGAIEVDWRDDHFEAFRELLNSVPQKESYDRSDIERLLDQDFDAAWTAARMILDLSKDSFLIALRREIGASSVRKTAYLNDRSGYLRALETLGVLNAMSRLAARDYSWKDLLAERLKAGRGTAIRGQRRGRALEDFAEGLVREVFGSEFEPRCSFIGADGTTRAKCDFAIPSSKVPRILIESKAYGATGSKQSDILGDAEKIIRAKRGDTNFLFITDGSTWRARRSDLRKLIALQNEGGITRIYTQMMRGELLTDLRTLRIEHSL